MIVVAVVAAGPCFVVAGVLQQRESSTRPADNLFHRPRHRPRRLLSRVWQVISAWLPGRGLANGTALDDDPTARAGNTRTAAREPIMTIAACVGSTAAAIVGVLALAGCGNAAAPSGAPAVLDQLPGS
ncbi:MAG: hypothetical protein ACRDUW_15585 [Pseudonocardiaceae bacterium]